MPFDALYTKEELIDHCEMPVHAANAFLALAKAGCPVKIWEGGDRGHFWIDAEEPEAMDWLDYWGNLMAGSEELQQILSDHDLYFEWYNPAYACVYDA
jgi:hypothetical protein